MFWTIDTITTDTSDTGAIGNAATKPCISCCSLIPDKARVCSICKSHQQEWRNILVFVGGFASLAAVIGSCAVFIYQGVVDIKKSYSWEDSVKVIYLKFPGEMLLMNSGNGDVVIESVVARTKEDPSVLYSIPVAQELSADKASTIKLQASQIDDPYVNAQGLSPLTNPSGIPTAAEIDEWRSDHQGCVRTEIASEGEPDFLNMESFVEKHNNKRIEKLQMTAEIHVTSVHTKKSFVAFLDNVYLVFVRPHNSQCDTKR